MDTPIRCIALDDEPLALEIILDYVEREPGLQLVASTTDADEALDLIRQGGIDLLFLDVQMPGITGIELVRQIGVQCDIILTTAYPQYALEGFELDVVDYLLKPIAFDRFQRAVQKVVSGRRALSANRQEQASGEAEDFFFVKTDYKLQRVNFDEVLYIEGLKDYVSIYTQKERIITLQLMKKLEEFLPSERFMRVHRSYIIALDKIDKVEKGRIHIQDKIIPIGDTYRESFSLKKSFNPHI